MDVSVDGSLKCLEGTHPRHPTPYWHVMTSAGWNQQVSLLCVGTVAVERPLTT